MDFLDGRWQYSVFKDYTTLDSFIPVCLALDIPQEYIESTSRVYSQCVDRSEFDWQAEMLTTLKFDAYQQLLIRKARQEISRMVTSVTSADKKLWFVTVNFDDIVVTDENETEVINKTIDKLLNGKKFEIENFVVEKYREGGKQIHRHIHMKVKFDGYKSKLAQFIFQSIPKTKNDKLKVVKAQNFVDVDQWCDRHENYIKGDKTSAKMPCVLMDREWRKKKDIKEHV